MFRNAVARPLLRANQRLVATRSFSVASVRMGAGDTGAPRGAAAASDSHPLVHEHISLSQMTNLSTQ